MTAIKITATADANDNVVLLSWLPTATIPECLGFALTRNDVVAGTKEELKSYVPFKGEENPNWQAQPTSVWPIQKCTWMDYSAKLGVKYTYTVTPMTGKPGSLTARTEMSVTTNEVTLTTQVTDQIKAAFTRGVLSTQWLTHALPTMADGTPDFEALLTAISTPGNSIRNRLMGNVLSMMKEQIEKAKAEGGHVYQALYELSDPEIVGFLMDNLDVFSLILSNTGKLDETNKPTREQLHAAGAKVLDRMVSDKSIGHNKTQVRTNKAGKPVAVQGGSANWTMTGLCCQSNNIIAIEDEGLAQVYKTYWDLLAADVADGNTMSAALRTENARRKEVTLKDGTRITVWFSPNTKDAVKPRTGAATPPDMAEVFDAMDKARQGVFFLAFYPGFPSIISKVAEMNNTRDDLILRGAVSSYDAMPKTKLFHRRGELPVIVSASGIEEQFANWHKELLKLPDAHAIIHDKLLVIDPWSETDCVVVVTSHNLGFKASYSNDENMMIIRGNRKLAMAYLVHILDVYNHYRFRSAIRSKRTVFKGFLSTDAGWQDKYVTGVARRELEYFTGTHILKAA